MGNKLFGRSRSVFQVVLTRLTPTDKTQLFLKLTNFDKSWLVAFHSFKTKKVISRGRGWPWFIFCHYQLTVVANSLLPTVEKSATTFLMRGPKPIIILQINANITETLKKKFYIMPHWYYTILWQCKCQIWHGIDYTKDDDNKVNPKHYPFQQMIKLPFKLYKKVTYLSFRMLLMFIMAKI